MAPLRSPGSSYASALPSGLITGPAVALPALTRFGTEDQKRRMLPRFCRGEELVCFAITETDVGSNTLNIKTRARFCSERYRFSGPKDFTTAADACHHVMTLARTTPREEVANGNEGSTVFLVPLDVPLPIPERYCQLVFDDVELGPEHVEAALQTRGGNGYRRSSGSTTSIRMVTTVEGGAA